jgi:hypothetical protein
MSLKSVGFFREFYDDEPDLPSIQDFVRSEPHPEVHRIIGYLRCGIGLAGVGKYVRDVLDPTSRAALTPGLETDGVWLWREDLSYYVGRHNVELPREFIDHMSANNWAVPKLTEAEVSPLSDWLYHRMGGK